MKAARLVDGVLKFGCSCNLIFSRCLQSFTLLSAIPPSLSLSPIFYPSLYESSLFSIFSLSLSLFAFMALSFARSPFLSLFVPCPSLPSPPLYLSLPLLYLPISLHLFHCIPALMILHSQSPQHIHTFGQPL